MAKKQFGKIIILAALAGAATAGISYLLKYKSFHKELDEDFRDFEDEFEEFGETDANSETTMRSYVSLNPDRQSEKPEEGTKPELKAEEPETCSAVIENIAEDTAAQTEEASMPVKAAEAAEAEAPADSAASTTIVEDTTE